MSNGNWVDGSLVAFDLETTGIDPETARIVTASLIEVGPDGLVEQHDWLADPGVEIPAEATEVHGITTEHARAAGRPAFEVVEEVRSELGRVWRAGKPLVVYNAPYDLTVTDRELRRYSHPGLVVSGAVVDPLVIDRAVDRYRRGSRKLLDVCRHYCVALPEDEVHSSVGDALAAARLAWRLGRTFPELRDLAGLQDRQREWYAAWAENFEGYLRWKHGSGETVSREWPIRAFAGAETR